MIENIILFSKGFCMKLTIKSTDGGINSPFFLLLSAESEEGKDDKSSGEYVLHLPLEISSSRMLSPPCENSLKING